MVGYLLFPFFVIVVLALLCIGSLVERCSSSVGVGESGMASNSSCAFLLSVRRPGLGGNVAPLLGGGSVMAPLLGPGYKLPPRGEVEGRERGDSLGGV